MECNKTGCKGTLVKLENYYVCNTCCEDTISYTQISNRVKEQRGALSKKPKDKYIEILHPELSGFYTYKEIFKTEWRKKFTIFGNDNKLIGTVEMEDYRKSGFVIHYNGPYCVINVNHQECFKTFSLNPNEIIFNK